MGRGNIVFPEGVRSFYAAQDVKLPQVSLKAAGLPARLAARNTRTRGSRRRFTKPALAISSSISADEAREGKAWDQVLSGGQKQKLVVARILLQQPGLLFLDEATGALDPEAKIAFHQAIKDNCPGITVISVMHESRAAEIGDGRRILRQRAPHRRWRRLEEAAGCTTCRPSSPRSSSKPDRSNNRGCDCHASASSRNSRLVVMELSVPTELGMGAIPLFEPSEDRCHFQVDG